MSNIKKTTIKFLANIIGKRTYPLIKPFLPTEKDKQKNVFVKLLWGTMIIPLITFLLLFFAKTNLIWIDILIVFSYLFMFFFSGAAFYFKYNEQNDTEPQETENLENYEDLRSKYTLHNVKNATTSLDRIVGSLEVNKLSQENIDDLKNYLERIYLTLDDFENNESSRLRKQESFAIKEVVNLFDKLVKASLKAQRIKFTIDNKIISEKIIHQNLWDVFQVLHNLVLNAQNALELPKIKEITLLFEEIDSSTIRFFVKDTGIGIPVEHKNKVFQVGFSTTGSSGLGLPYIKDTVEKMKGKVTLLNADENFSTIFEVIIPSEKI